MPEEKDKQTEATGSVEDLRALLRDIRRNIENKSSATVSEYIRLLEFLSSMEKKTAAEVRVGWCDSLREG